MASPLVGAWELVSDTDQGIMIFTETHYSGVAMSKNRKRSESKEQTPEAGLEVLQNVRALAGTYTVGVAVRA